jgi:hypothetical protein
MFDLQVSEDKCHLIITPEEVHRYDTSKPLKVANEHFRHLHLWDVSGSVTFRLHEGEVMKHYYSEIIASDRAWVITEVPTPDEPFYVYQKFQTVSA